MVPNGNDARLQSPTFHQQSSSIILLLLLLQPSQPSEAIISAKVDQAVAKKALQPERAQKARERESVNSVSFLKSVRLLMFCWTQKIQDH
jgi:hypothetical protein